MVKVSVVMPVYNEEKYISEAIESFLEDDFEDIEIIVVDDASEDKTIQIVDDFIKKDSRIKLIRHEKNKGCAAALNTGITQAKGEYISFFGGDDWHIPGRFEKQIETLKKGGDFTWGDFIKVYEGKEEYIQGVDLEDGLKSIQESSKRKDIGELAPCRLISEEGIIPGSSVLWNRKITDSGFKFDENIKYHEDCDFWLQIIGAGFKGKHVNVPCFRYRIHGNQKSKNPKRINSVRKINQKLKSGAYFKNK